MLKTRMLFDSLGSRREPDSPTGGMPVAAHPDGSKADAAISFARQAEQLSLLSRDEPDEERVARGTAVEARFITPLDPVIETADGHRLPAVPLPEAQKLNHLKDVLDSNDSHKDRTASGGMSQEKQRKMAKHASTTAEEEMDETDEEEERHPSWSVSEQSTKAGASLRSAIPPSRTHPLFPPLPLYGPPTTLRKVQVALFRVTSTFLSLAFLMVIVLGSTITVVPAALRHVGSIMVGKDPLKGRPFYEEEKRRKLQRRTEEKQWVQQHSRKRKRAGSRSAGIKEVTSSSVTDGSTTSGIDGTAHGPNQSRKEASSTPKQRIFVPTEGGPDPLICDIGYYARRVGLDVEEFEVQTEDGFLIELYHVYDPSEYTPKARLSRRARSPDVFVGESTFGSSSEGAQAQSDKKRYPVLLIHGLLQSMGAYAVNDDDSLAFYLCKQGYDVWLGNNRCGFKPRHTLLSYSDPRMWAWNIRQMGVMDLPALISRVLAETGFGKLALVAHSQGTTQTFVALAKEQRPELGSRISVFCALAPAVYAGPLIDKMQFKWMRLWNPATFRIWFGILSFIPFMMSMHEILPGSIYGALGYRVFSFLFSWSDARWERDLRDRFFQFSPVYVSSESMRWWLGRECFAKHRCILATREQEEWEEKEIRKIERKQRKWKEGHGGYEDDEDEHESPGPAGRTSWYDERAPPFAIWVCGNDKLVDGRRLLRRLEAGREPDVKVVHAKVIPEYEHLDVIWAMDAKEKVGKEIKDVIWKTMSEEDRAKVEVPEGCGGVTA